MFTLQSGTKWEILKVIRTKEEVTIEVLEEELQVSPSTINEHLSDLQAKDLIDKRAVRNGPGRPHYVYFLTGEAEHLFPHAYAQLATMLLEVIRSLAEEPEAREKIVTVMKRHVEEYDNLQNALQTLGFYPEFEGNEGEQSSNKIIYHQCPFHDVATKDPSICEIDKRLLEELTGRKVEMNSSIATGKKRCEFVLSEN